jgi:hypothetical protein
VILLATIVAARGLDFSREGTRSPTAGPEAFTYAIQSRLEECVVQDDESYRTLIEEKFKVDPKQRRRYRKDAVAGPLLEGARKGFSAFVRAYPAKEKAIRHIFNASKWGAFRLWEGREAKFPIGSLQCGCNE